jgi:transcriptional regulator PpsR
MNIAFVPEGTRPFRFPDRSLGLAAEALASRALTLAGDVTLVLDAKDVIVDVALGGPGISEAWVDELIGKSWGDTVTTESRTKIEQLAQQARQGGGPPRWRQINHISALGEIPVRYVALATDKDGCIIAIGRDMRSEAALQQRLLHAQQSIERDYVKMRQIEARYRQLFDLASEAVLVADTASRRIIEANPAALQMLGLQGKGLDGQIVPNLFAPDSRDAILSLLGAVAAAEQNQAVTLNLSGGGGEVTVSASLFRQDRGSCFLIRLMPVGGVHHAADPSHRPLLTVMDSMPDALVITDESLAILTSNSAFLDMVQVPRKEQVMGQGLSRYLGRPGIDLNLLLTELRDHGAARSFVTIIRTGYGSQENVEVSAVSVDDDGGLKYGFSIRRAASRTAAPTSTTSGLPQTVEQLTELVGRVALKDIVKESTDLIERLCIEAALVYTSDNRASAAEILGLSRQSLYSKLHRHGLGNFGDHDGVE